MKPSQILSIILPVITFYSCSQKREIVKGHENNAYYSRSDTTRLKVPNAEWKNILPKELYAVAREANT